MLAVVWAVDRFKYYLLGREFTIATDQKALTSALGENRLTKRISLDLQDRLIDCFCISSKSCIYLEKIWV